MIQKLFDHTKPAYIQHRNGRLIFDGREHDSLQATIHDIVPVRKLFTGNQLTCWSINNAPGREKRICAFCPDATHCQKRLRLNLLVHGENGAAIPAAIEVRATAFDTLNIALEGTATEPETWTDILFQLSVTHNARGFEDITLTRIF